jgi:hypothetical protein
MSVIILNTGCNRRNGLNFGSVYLVLNYIEKPQNTYIQSWTVWEIMAIENCGFPSCPRTIALSWSAGKLIYSYVCSRSCVLKTREWNAFPSRLSSSRCGFIVTVWQCTEMLICLSYFLTWNIATCILYMVFAMVIRELQIGRASCRERVSVKV